MPKTAPSAPSASAAASPRPSAKPPGGDQWQVADRVAHRGNQRERGRLTAHVAAGLEALRHHGVASRFLRPARFVGRAALPDDLDTRAMREPDRVRVLARVTPEKGQHLDRRPHDGFDDSGPQERDDQIGRERFRGATPRRGELVLQVFGVEGREPHSTKPTRLGNGGGQLRQRDTAHPGRENRQLDTEEFTDSGL